MNKPAALSLAGVMLLAVILVGAFALLNWPWLTEGPSQLAERPPVTPTFLVVENATPEPVTPAVSPTEMAPTEIPPTESPATTPIASIPIPTPAVPLPPWPAEPPMLPALASQLIGGVGGGGGSETVPPQVTYLLNIELPASPPHLTVWGQTLELLTVERAAELAANWGLVKPRVYMPLWMVEAQNLALFGRRNYAAVDDPRQLSFEGVELIHYWDRSVFPARGGRTNPPAGLPPVEEAIQLATDFLRARGLLNTTYDVRSPNYETTGTIDFVRLLDGQWKLLGPFARVTLGAGGRIGWVEYTPLNVQSLGDYPILSAAEAWELVSRMQTDGRVWYQIESGRWSQGERPVQHNPRHWGRAYQAGESVHLFGPLYLQYPAASGYPPHVIMNDLVLQGENLAELAELYEDLRLSTGDTETPMHVWGQVMDAGGYLTLQVQGWESVAGEQTIWSGTVQRSDGLGSLLTDDGLAVDLPGLPAADQLPAGTPVFVSGGLWESRLEWLIIQEHPADEGMMPSADPLPAEILATVEHVELVYLSGSLANLSPEQYADPSFRSIQPAWRFSGRTDQGRTFEVLVQAVVESFLFSPAATQ